MSLQQSSFKMPDLTYFAVQNAS